MKKQLTTNCSDL